MQRPIPGVFQGSMPAEAVIGARLGSDIERALGGTALVLALGTWMLTFALSGQSPWLASKVASVVLLVIAVLGLWLKRKAAQAPQRDTADIYRAVLRTMPEEGGAVRNAPAVGGYAGLAGLIRELTVLLRRTQARRAKLETALAAGRSDLQERRRQAQTIAGEIARAAENLSEAAVRATSTDDRILRGAENAARSLDGADNAVTRAIDGIATIAGSVRATTAGAQQMTLAAVQMADVAHDTHRRIAGLDDKTAKMVVALDSIERALQVASALGHAASAGPEEQGASAAACIASTLQEVAGSCQPALADAGAALRELCAQTAEASRRTMEIAELIGANHDIGRAVSHAVERQGEEIARILTELYEARPGFATLRAGVEAVTLACGTRADDSESMRNTAHALPNQAERLARVLRDLPDLTPPADH